MTVVCFADDPGGANGIIALASEFEAMTISYVVYADRPADSYCAAHGLKTKNLPDCSSLALEKPAALVVGASSRSDSKSLACIDWARQNSIPSFAFVDACINAESRFRGSSQKPLCHRPNYLFVTEEKTGKAFADFGFEPVDIFEVGNPRYDFVKKRARILAQENREAARRRLFGEGDPDTRIILFLADPLQPAIGAHFKDSGFRARSPDDIRSHIVLQFLLDTLVAMEGKTSVFVKLHPRNNPGDFSAFAGQVQLFQGHEPGIDLAFGADLVVGTTTSLLVEAALLDTPAVGALLTPQERQWLPDDLPDNLSLALSEQELAMEIVRLLDAGPGNIGNNERFFINSGRRMAEKIRQKVRC